MDHHTEPILRIVETRIGPVVVGPGDPTDPEELVVQIEAQRAQRKAAGRPRSITTEEDLRAGPRALEAALARGDRPTRGAMQKLLPVLAELPGVVDEVDEVEKLLDDDAVVDALVASGVEPSWAERWVERFGADDGREFLAREHGVTVPRAALPAVIRGPSAEA